MNESWLILVGLTIFLLGFWIGRKVGVEEGFKSGLEQAPMEIKRRSLETGHCLICGVIKNFQDFAGKL